MHSTYTAFKQGVIEDTDGKDRPETQGSAVCGELFNMEAWDHQQV
jgi:hypothetical protein